MNIPNLSSLKGLATLGKTFVLANRPEILFGTSIAATLGSVALAAKGGYEARGVVDAAQAQQTEPLTTQQKANLTWHCYLPAGAATIGALGATTGLHLVHVSEKKVLVQTALGAIEEVKEAAREFERENGVGVLSEKEKDSVLSKRADKETGKAKVLYAGDGVEEELYRVKEEYTGRVFWSTKEKIDSAVNEVNKAIVKNGCADINTFYMWAGIEELDRGIEEGWSGEHVTLTWEDGRTENGKPCLVFRFRTPPKKGYDNSHA